MDSLLEHLLLAPRDTSPLASLAAFRDRAGAACRSLPSLPTSVEKAVRAGFYADRVAYAFAGGYQAALEALVAETEGRPMSLCATEPEGGAHPRAVRTRLDPSGYGYLLHGTKRWATLATHAQILLVVATTGTDLAGKNQLRLVRVDPKAKGVRIDPMPETPFAPEVPHAEIVLDAVTVGAGAVLDGDGYTRYVKPFRTVEDVHVHAALVGYLFGVARDRGWSHAAKEDLLALAASLVTIGMRDPSSRATHIALAGILRTGERVIHACEAEWEAGPPGDDRARWKRDRPLLGVAKGAREKRAEAAWEGLERPSVATPHATRP